MANFINPNKLSGLNNDDSSNDESTEKKSSENTDNENKSNLTSPMTSDKNSKKDGAQKESQVPGKETLQGETNNPLPPAKPVRQESATPKPENVSPLAGNSPNESTSESDKKEVGKEEKKKNDDDISRRIIEDHEQSVKPVDNQKQPVRQEKKQSPMAPVMPKVRDEHAAPKQPEEEIQERKEKEQGEKEIEDKKSDDNIPLDASKIPYWLETQNLIEKLEDLFGTRVINLYITMKSSITNAEVDEIYNHLYRMGKQKELVLVIHGPGGHGKAAYRIVKLVRQFTERLIIVAPGTAASAMTMLSLGADEIKMGPLSYMTPIDSSIANHPLAPRDVKKRPVSVEINQVQKYLELVNSSAYEKEDDFRKTPYAALTEKVHPLFLGTIQRSLSLSKLLTRGIASTHITDNEVINNLVNKLNDEYPIHSYPILKDDLVEMGVNVTDLTDKQNLVCQELFSYYNALGQEGRSVKDNIRVTSKRYVFIESTGLRSYVLFSSKERYADKKWQVISSNIGYKWATVVNNKHGYREANVLNTKQFRKWMKGEKIELGKD